MSTKRLVITAIALVVIVGGALLAYQVMTFTSSQRAKNERILVKGALDVSCAGTPASKPACDFWVSELLDTHYAEAKACYDNHDHLRQPAAFSACLVQTGVAAP